jgi:transposase-like protein
MAKEHRRRGPYPPEFRRQAVEYFRASERSQEAIAGELGVARETLRAWIKQDEIDAGEREA